MRHSFLVLILLILFLPILACGQITIPSAPDPEVILERLHVAYLGQDGQKLIGSGCPGNFGRGEIDNLHFIVSGIDPNRRVVRVLVAGDNATLIWEWPCYNSWALLAQPLKPDMWEIFIAPSQHTDIYTIIVFYHDNSMALGMITVP